MVDGAVDAVLSQEPRQARVDDCRVLSEIIFINRNGLRWCDTPKEYSPQRPSTTDEERWCIKGVFARMMMEEFASKAAVRRR
jgi:transposase